MMLPAAWRLNVYIRCWSDAGSLNRLTPTAS